jgi:transposase-like protein
LRRKYETAIKTRVALEAIRGQKTIAEIALEYDVPANLVTLWKNAALENLPGTFSRKAEKKARDWEEERNDLYR